MKNNNILRNRELLWVSENPHTFCVLNGIIDKVYLFFTFIYEMYLSSLIARTTSGGGVPPACLNSYPF